MATIYMDQWVYVNLLRCYKGLSPEYPKYVDASRAVIETSRDDKHKYPFSIAHLHETMKRTKLYSRKELYKSIFEISKFNTIRPWVQVLDLEIRNAVLKLAGTKPINLNNFVFGDELGHCFGSKGEFKPNSETKISEDILKKLHEAYRNPELVSDALSKDKMIEFVEKLIKGDNELAEKLEILRKKDYSHPDKKMRKKISSARFFIDIIQDDFIKAVNDFRLDFKKFTKYVFQSEEHATAFLKSIPTAYVFHVLNDARNMNFSRPIEPNDLWDLGTLAITVPYCDIVVTEREWANILNEKKIGELYDTKITHKIEDLPRLL